MFSQGVPQIQYTSEDLKTISKACTSRLIPSSLEYTLRSFSLFRRIGTRRKKRAGRKFYHPTPVIKPETNCNGNGAGCYIDNLVTIPRVDKKATGLQMGLLNAQSVRNKLDIIRDLIIEHDLDILALNETWITTAEKDKSFEKGLSLPGYKPFLVPRKGNKGYGGVGILYKASMDIASKSSTDFNSFEHCKIIFKTESHTLDVNVVYRPPPSPKNKLTATMFFEEFTTFVQDQVTSAGDMLLVGDVNFHLDVSTDPDTKKFLTLIDSVNLKQHVMEPTHRSGHTLDVVITRESGSIIQSLQVGDMISDHTLITCQVKHPKPIPMQATVMTRKLRSICIEDFRQDVTKSLPVCDDLSDVRTLVSDYNQVLESTLDKHAPLKTKTITLRPKQPWFTDKLYRAKCDKRLAEHQWRKTRLIIHREIYCTKRTEYNHLLAEAKKCYYHTKIVESGQDSKALKKVVDDILHKNQVTILPSEIL
jgi:exonuclease III